MEAQRKWGIKQIPILQNMTRLGLLSLVRDLDKLITQRHARRVLLCGDSAGLGLVFNKGDALSAGNQPDFPKALKPTEDTSKRLDVVIIIRHVLHEQDLVRRQVLVRHDGVRSS